MNYDPYDNGTPKYKTAQSIYDGLYELTSGEEICILSEMFPDVSYDNQDYYYQDNGHALRERIESEYGDKLWLLDLAILQIDRDDIHDTVYEALHNADLAKRLGFKKLFVEHLLRGDNSQYDEISEEFYSELQDLDRFQWQRMNAAYMRVMERHGRQFYVYPQEYGNLCTALVDRVQNLHLQKETHLIAECRAFLTSYDDFIFGLRMNQELFNAQERMYGERVARLEAAYAEQIRQLNTLAEQYGIPLANAPEPILLGVSTETELDIDLLGTFIKKQEEGDT